MHESIHYIGDTIHMKSESTMFASKAWWIDSGFVWYDSYEVR